MQWLLRRLGRGEFSVLRWLDGDLLAGFAVDDSGYVSIHAATPSLDQHLKLLELTESYRREKGQTTIEVSVWDDDRELLSALRALGYEPSGTSGRELIYELGDATPEPRLPEGFSMRSLEPKLDQAYVELHRAAWSTWAPSTYDREMHASVTSMPDFERELVPIVAAPDGTLAAYCVAWFDPQTQTVEIEPLGTRPEFRRLGLARAIVHEVQRRSTERSATTVMVWSVSKNPEARRVYESAGFRRRRMLHELKRTL